MVELITAGKPIPGIREIPNVVLEAPAQPSAVPVRRKPWERQVQGEGGEETDKNKEKANEEKEGKEEEGGGEEGERGEGGEGEEKEAGKAGMTVPGGEAQLVGGGAG